MAPGSDSGAVPDGEAGPSASGSDGGAVPDGEAGPSASGSDGGAVPDGEAGPSEAGGGAGPAAPPPGKRRFPVRAGRNLPAALGVGLLMGALALITLFTVKATFLAYMAVVAGLGLWEMVKALRARGIRLPLPPVAVGGAAAVALAYWYGERAFVAAFAVTVIAVLAWRLPGGSAGYLRDVTAGTFTLAYVPMMAGFVALLLVPKDGPDRVLIFVLLAVCSDIGGYVAGILLGRHKMAPVISPKKTWEGLAGSVLACLIAGGIAVPGLLGGAPWQGVVLGAAAVAAATLGDLAASMAKRDLQIKDWGSLLPGHGGVLDRIDSLLITAPVVWLVLLVFLPTAARR